MAFDFPSSPSNGQVFSPPGGPTYTWDAVKGAWMVSMVGVPDAPSDGNEYVRVNGVWRLKTQIILAAAAMTIIVPATAKTAHIYGQLYYTAGPSTAVLQVGSDASTVFSGASDYTIGGTNTFSGSNASPSKQALTATNAWTLMPNADNLNTPSQFEAHLTTSKLNGNLFNMMWRGTAFLNASTLYQQDVIWEGYCAAAGAGVMTQMPMFRISSSNINTANSRITVEWGY